MATMPILQSQAWDGLMARLSSLSTTTATGLTNVTLALLIGLVGWGVATAVATVTRVLLRALRFNDGVRGLSGGGMPRHEPAAMAAWAVYWAILIVALVLALDTMGFNIGTAVTDRLTEVLPRIVVSGVLLSLGVLLAMLLGSIIRRFFDTAGIAGGRLKGQVVTAVLTGFAALVALEQLGFAAQFVMAVGLVALGGVGIALGLAFGLGCRDLARDFVVEYLRSLDQTGPQRPA
jgi:hypothetical protein